MRNKNLVLAAMVFSVAMTFIDQTIVAIAIPSLQRDQDLTQTGSQWIINGYLLALSALFAFGGKLGDVLGRRRMVVVGVIGFAAASALCGFTPTADAGSAWIIFWRVVRGAFAALMFPAAVGIVVASFPLHERGRAMAIFFGISGGLTGTIASVTGWFPAEHAGEVFLFLGVSFVAQNLVVAERSFWREPHAAQAAA